MHRRGFNTTDDENANENLTLNECKIKHTISKATHLLLPLLVTTSIGHFASKPKSGIQQINYQSIDHEDFSIHPK